MPYCRRCGAQLEENARFCHKCGVQAVTFTPVPSARPASKNLLSTPEIVLIALAVVAIIVIASIFVFVTFNSANMNQTNSSNQTKVNTFSFRIQEGNTQTIVSAPDFMGKLSLTTVSASSAHPSNRIPLPP